MTFNTVLVANRGEIASRVIRTCRERGIRTVAVHADVDADAPHVGQADVAVALPGPPVAAYLDIESIIAAARTTGADALHPGYGFLSENPAMPKACADAGITFIGPSSDVIRLMGDKAASKRAAADAGVPVLESIDPSELDRDELHRAVAALGLPVIVKAVSGGGGKGMRRVDDLDQLDDAVATAAREAAAAFGDDRLLVERFVTAPRHVEVQVAGDSHGGAIHLFERDCSIQRRHQKIVEEAPSPALDPALRDRMGAAAVALVRREGYTNLGTVEFLLDTSGDGTDFSFLEMNTRLQVEHPVTELVTGLDLVGCQLDIAAGGTVPERPGQPIGHAIEVRLYAEDVPAGFLPQTGTLRDFTIPDTVRVDSGVTAGSVVSPHFDPMLAKVIAVGDDREQARTKLVAALGDAVVTGVVTNLGHLLDVLGTQAFIDGDFTTGFLETHLPDWRPASLDEETLADVAAVLSSAAIAANGDAGDPWVGLGPWRSSGTGGWSIALGNEAATAEQVTVAAPPGWRWHRNRAVPSNAGRREPGLQAYRDGDHVWISRPGHGSRRLAAPRRVRHVDHFVAPGTATLTAPMPGQVLAVAVSEGQSVAAGDVLVVVEAMKMEHRVVAPGPGTVTSLDVAVGDAVAADQVLIGFKVTDQPPDEEGGDSVA